jgi:hypothetical protein
VQAAKGTTREPAELEMHQPAFVRDRHRPGIDIHQSFFADNLPHPNLAHDFPLFLILVTRATAAFGQLSEGRPLGAR